MSSSKISTTSPGSTLSVGNSPAGERDTYSDEGSPGAGPSDLEQCGAPSGETDTARGVRLRLTAKASGPEGTTFVLCPLPGAGDLYESDPTPGGSRGDSGTDLRFPVAVT